ncbi:MAG: SPASM domain-containing protein, partial [Ruminococcus sp.]|nr:SPASM domain-containing protein [Ruminococcus sp.]
DKAMLGIQNLIDRRAFKDVQITTVVHKGNIGELEQLYELLLDVDIDSWRVINIDPIGRAKQHPELLLDADDYRRLFGFIAEKRRQGMPLLYGCEHYLGVGFEREVRDWYFLCNAGLYTAGIRSNGDIGACLDIESRPELIEGNILRDDFTELWHSGFKPYRRDLSERDEKCRSCPEKRFCAGGAFHSFDFDGMRQQVCFKGVLF